MGVRRWESYHFDHFLVLSKTYTLSDEEAETTLATLQQQKFRKGAPAPSSVGGVSAFHHEDILLIQQVCLALSMHPLRLEGHLIQKLSSNSLDYIPCLTHLPVTKTLLEFNRGVA
jgi:hypothetical protein